MTVFSLPDIPLQKQALTSQLFHKFTISEYESALANYPAAKTHSNLTLHCLAQDKLSKNYEVEIYEAGTIATREYNWHDYFNLCIWVNFPKTKAAINYLHYSEMKHKTQKNRTPIENAMTLFDENGAVIISDDEALLELIRQHEWKKLFWQHRKKLLKNLRIVIVGHSLYEKFLDPYIGMTAHTVLWHVEDINLDNAQIDKRLAQDLIAKQYASPKSLQPLPILGYPGWFDLNCNESFYDNPAYFRPTRELASQRLL